MSPYDQSVPINSYSYTSPIALNIVNNRRLLQDFYCIDDFMGSMLLIFLVFCVVYFALFVFVLCRVYPMLPVSLDCSFLTAPLFVFVLCRVYPMLSVSLDCSFLTIPSISTVNVYLMTLFYYILDWTTY